MNSNKIWIGQLKGAPLLLAAVLAIQVLAHLNLECCIGRCDPPPLPRAKRAGPPSGEPDEPRLPLAEERLTIADIPADVPQDLRKELAGTFDRDPRARAKYAETIGKRGSAAAAAVPFLIRLLCDDIAFGELREGVSYSASMALKGIGRPAVEPCISALNRSSGEPRLEIIRTLARIGDRRAIDPLASLLSSRYPEVRANVVLALDDLNDPAIAPHLAQALKDDQDEIREWAATELARHPDPKVAGALIACLSDKSDTVRAAAVKSLGKQGNPQAAPALLQILKSPAEDSSKRFRAALSLGELRDAGGHAALLAALNDRAAPEGLRAGAAAGLGFSRNATFVAALTAVANDETDNAGVRANAIDAIARLTGRDTIPLLKQLVKPDRKDLGARCSAAVALVRLTGGAVEGLDTISALHGPYLTDDGSGAILFRDAIIYDAVRSISEHGKTEEVRTAAKARLNQRWPRGRPEPRL